MVLSLPKHMCYFRPFFIYLNLADISVIITWVTWSSNGPTDITRPGSGLQLPTPGLFYVLTIIDLYIFIFTWSFMYDFTHKYERVVIYPTTYDEPFLSIFGKHLILKIYWQSSIICYWLLFKKNASVMFVVVCHITKISISIFMLTTYIR